MFANYKKLWIMIAAVLLLGAIGGGAGAGIAFATGGDDQPINGPELALCTAAALSANPGGVVTETEVGDDDGGAFEVEIRLEDGSEIEVQLDENCNVIGQEPDDDGNGEDDETDDE